MSIEVNEALAALRRGPKGGDLDNPNIAGKPEWKQEHLNSTVLPNGAMTLHRFDKGQGETAAPRIKDEQPWHLMAAYMLLNGLTNSEVAMAARVTPQQISHLRAQRWFQERLATIANREGDEVLGILKGEAMASLEKLIELRDTSESDRIQLAAATTILEHSQGKPVQKTISLTASTHFSSPVEELAQLNEELSALRSQSPEIPEAQAVSVK